MRGAFSGESLVARMADIPDRRYSNAAISVTRKTTRKIKNKIRATPAAAEATPPKPNTPAIKATTAKISAQVSSMMKLLTSFMVNRGGLRRHVSASNANWASLLHRRAALLV
jgi:hypothetical protein